MAYLFNIFAFVVIGIAGSHFRGTSAEANSSTRHWRKKPIHQLNLTVAWIERPPYLNSPSNESIEDEVAGLFRDVVLKYLISECDYTDENYKYIYNVRTKKAQSEFEMIELLRQDEAHIAAPIFKQQHDDHYSEFLFFKVLNYPGTEYITTAEEETRAIIVVFNSLLKSWPLLAFTLILTAIAGIIIWVLVSITLLLILRFLPTSYPHKCESKKFLLFLSSFKLHYPLNSYSVFEVTQRVFRKRRFFKFHMKLSLKNQWKSNIKNQQVYSISLNI